jgi:DNA modification methylase
MLVAADARRIPLPDNSVQCVVTSPPYWGLRKYAGEQELVWAPAERTQADPFICIEEGHLWVTERYYTEQTAASETAEAFSQPGAANAARLKNGRWRETNTCRRCDAWRGAYGLEPTVEMYVQHTVEILREIQRVLRPDGVVFWNIGDSYQSGDRGTYMRSRVVSEKSMQYGKHQEPERAPNRLPQLGLKPKDLCLIPERVALAAQADGWYVRARILWCKPNPMPESVCDRPTDAAEHIWMFTKSLRYFWDAEAVREESQSGPSDVKKQIEGLDRIGGKTLTADDPLYKANMNTNIGQKRAVGYPGSRNLRNVWTFATQPQPDYACKCGAVYPSRRSLDRRTVRDEGHKDRTEYRCASCLSWTDWVSHFATFPEELPRRCILAATSARGACRFCGTPWERVVDKPIPPVEMRTEHHGPDDGLVMGFGSTGSRYGTGQKMQDWLNDNPAKTIGWQPGCRCPGQRGVTVPCLVLDPFGGSGTTARAATELNRRAVSLDIAYAHSTGYAALADARTRDVQRNLPI